MSESVGPRFVQLRIVDDLRARIASGELPPGAKLPSTRELMAEFGVSTQTVQRAIGILKSEGVVEAFQAKGVFVRQPRELISRTYPPSSEDAHRRAKPQSILVSRTRPPEDIAEALGLDARVEVVVQHAVLSLGREPVTIISAYYSPEVTHGVDLADIAPPSDGYADDLVDLGFVPHHVNEHVQGRMPTPDEARTLGISAGVAVFRVVRSLVAEDGRILEVLVMVMAADRYRLVYDNLRFHD